MTPHPRKKKPQDASPTGLAAAVLDAARRKIRDAKEEVSEAKTGYAMVCGEALVEWLRVRGVELRVESDGGIQLVVPERDDEDEQYWVL